VNTQIVSSENGVDCSAPVTTLEDDINDEIAAIRSATWPNEQQPEVAIKFLCEARALARAGRAQLAERKRKAARCVLKGGGEDE
jgi:hypothetical protein